MDLCPELREYKSITTEVINFKIKSMRLQMDLWISNGFLSRTQRTQISNIRTNKF